MFFKLKIILEMIRFDDKKNPDVSEAGLALGIGFETFSGRHNFVRKSKKKI